MTLTHKNSSINIEGSVKNSEDLSTLKVAIESSIVNSNALTLVFKDTFVINSSLIGYLVNLINEKNIDISVHVGNDALYELIDYLGMKTLLKLQMI